MKIAHEIVITYDLEKQVDDEVLDSWMLYYNRCHWFNRGGVDWWPAKDVRWTGNCVDDLLNKYRSDAKWCEMPDYLLVTWFGVYSHDFWEWHQHVIDHVNDIEDQTGGNWLLTGNIIDYGRQKKKPEHNGHHYIYPIASVINMKKWRELGEPAWDQGDNFLYVRGVASEETIHDDYTPLILKPGTEVYKSTLHQNGDGMVAASLKAGLPVFNTSIQMRKNTLHTYPENNPYDWGRMIQSYMSMSVIDDTKHLQLITSLMQKRNLRHNPDGHKGVFFILNTEKILPPEKESEARAALLETNTIITPCSMFKSFMLMKEAPNVRNFVHFDIYKRNVLWKEYITEHWDGTLAHLTSIVNELPENEGEYDFWLRSNNTGSRDILDRVYSDLIDVYGTAEEMQTAWQVYKSKTHKYTTANLLFADSPIIRALKEIDPGVIYTAIGDIPGFGVNALQYGVGQLSNLSIAHLERLDTFADKLYVDIKNPKDDDQIFGTLDEVVHRMNNTARFWSI